MTEIVGIVGDIRSRRLDQSDDVEFYRPIQQRIFPFMVATVRSSLPVSATATAVRAALARSYLELPMIQPGPLAQLDELRTHWGRQRLSTTLLGNLCYGRAASGADRNLWSGRSHRRATPRQIGVRMRARWQTGDVLGMVIRRE